LFSWEGGGEGGKIKKLLWFIDLNNLIKKIYIQRLSVQIVDVFSCSLY